MTGASNSGPPSEVIITVEPPRESWRRNDELRAEVGNDASTLSEWLFEEAAWFLAQFLKVAVSVAAFRGIHQLFRSRLANESAYRRAPDLWSHGHQKPEGRRENGPRPEWTRSATGPFADRPRASSATGNGSRTTWRQMSRSTWHRSKDITSTSTAGGSILRSNGPVRSSSRRHAGRARSSSTTEAGQRSVWRSGR